MADQEKNTFIETEHEVLRFWEENDCFGKLRAKNAGHTRFRFLDGPITANNPMGIHHAWGRSLKDIFIRYKAMQGYDCRYQNGFDAQGLWVEVEVEKELGFKTKRDIEEYGMDKFTKKCVERVKKFSGIITEQSKRLGQWMDWDNSYFTHTDKNIQGIWYFLQKCNENGWLRKEYKPMPWCPRCGTSLSEHEMTGSYKLMTHNSVFFKLPIVETGKKILVWTTTPWTLSSNVALAVNPEIDYVEVRIASDDATLICAKNAIKYLGDDKQEVLRMFKGAELVGLHFETCFPEIVRFIDKTYRTKAQKKFRAIAGLSMGGFHSCHISKQYPTMFNYVGLFSAAISREKPGETDIYKNFDEKLATLFAPKNRPALYYIAIGKTDFLYQDNQNLRKKMDDNGYPYVYVETEGGHIWRNWRYYLADFCPRLFK